MFSITWDYYGAALDFVGLRIHGALCSPYGLGKPTCTLAPWRRGFRHPTRNECTGWFAQILPFSRDDVFVSSLGLSDMDLHERCTTVWRFSQSLTNAEREQGSKTKHHYDHWDGITWHLCLPNQSSKIKSVWIVEWTGYDLTKSPIRSRTVSFQLDSTILWFGIIDVDSEVESPYINPLHVVI